jgi:Mg2+-importing ATPase
VLYQGTHVVSGSGRALAVRTGKHTEFGRISERIRLRPAETESEQGVRRFGYFLAEVTLVMVFAIFALNVYWERPILDSFLFALALAVGLTPQLLPAIITVNLAHGARQMARQKVIVKRLAAIENFGSMNVLCSDKTGTLTEGRVRVHAAVDACGEPSDQVGFFAYVNSSFQSAFRNPIDEAIRASRSDPLDGWRKLDETPYDFARKRLSILAEHAGRAFLVTKGAFHKVLEVSAMAAVAEGKVVPIGEVRPQAERQYEELSARGFRTLGVAVKELNGKTTADREDEREMIFLGILALADPAKPGVAETVAALERLGVQLKIITGDNAQVAARVGEEVGLRNPRLLTSEDLALLSDDALPVRALATDIFAEIEPNEKERIVRALRKAGRVVGYMGDGINDAPALHAADVSISVQGAVDVAKGAADLVLMEKELAVLEAGVREGRRTFANTLKYVFMATSANFGNMFSVAGSSLFLPFLPLLPKQILLTNLLTDFPELTIATDRVDAEWVERPHRWDIAMIRKFMLVFGLVSSFFDYLTFAFLLYVLDAKTAEFRTGWFVESVVSAALIVLVIRTRRPFFTSLPSRPLLFATAAVVAGAVALPYLEVAEAFGFVPLPASFLGAVALIVAAYVATAELAKRWFYRGAAARS